MSPTNIFLPASTSASWIFDLSMMVFAITAVIFLVVGGLLLYSIVKFRKKQGDDEREPAQIYGSKHIELAWTIIPILIVIVLVLASTRVIAFTQGKTFDKSAVDVTVVGHQYWWEYRYPGLGVVTANELHIPVSDPASPTPTKLKIYSADTVHSFWVPRLGGKVDAVPNFPNDMWIDPPEPFVHLGQCAQFCGTQHAKMLIRVYVQSKEEFARWIEEQRQPARPTEAVARGREVFEKNTCMSCHTISGTPATGRFGPDLTHLMSRETLGAGIIPNTRQTLRGWIQDPNQFKPGSLMPAMGLNEADLDAVTDYLLTLR